MSLTVKPIGAFAKVLGGKRLPKGSSFSNNKTTFPYIRVCDFSNFSVDTSDLKYLDEKVQRTISRYTISSKDIYISIAGTIGLVGIVPDDLSGANLTENAAKIVIQDLSQVDPRYLVWFLATKGQHQIELHKKSTSQPKLALFRIAEITVPLPPLEKQKRIAAILDKADGIRRKRRQAMAMADEFLRSVFLDMFGDPVTNPKGWEVRKLGSLAKNIRNGLSPSSTGTHPGTVFTLSAVTGSVFQPQAIKDAFFDKKPTPFYANSNDFLICRGNGNLNLVGKAKFPKGDFTSTAFPDTIIAVSIQLQEIMHSVLETQWDTFFIRNQIEKSARTTNGTYKINQSIVEEIYIIVPKIKQQQIFQELADKIKLHSEKICNCYSEKLLASISSKYFY